MASFSRRRSFGVDFAALCVVYAASVVGYVRSQSWPGAWLLLVPALAALFSEFDGVGERLRRGERDAWLLVGLTGIVGVGWTLYAMVDERLLALLRGVLGSGLVLMGGFFVAGRRVWHPGRGLVPVCLGLLVVGGLDPYAGMLVPTVLASGGLLVWLALVRPATRPAGTHAPPAWKSLLMLVPAAVLAGGVSVLLPWAQPLVESALAGAMAGPEALSGMSGDSRLGDIEKLAMSRELVLRLWSDTPLRLRARVLTQFDGGRWTTSAGPPRSLPVAPAGLHPKAQGLLADLPGETYLAADPSPATNIARAVVLPNRLDHGVLVAPQGPLLLRVAGGSPFRDAAGVLSAPFWPAPEIFGIAYTDPEPKAPDAEEVEAALQVPAGLDPRVAALAQELSEGAATDAERVDRTLFWLAREHRYALDVGPFHSDQPVAEFLFEKKRGYCEYFASAAALLLRLQGVPTRYVAGFSVSDGSRSGDHYVVRASDAHAWIESWLEGFGWLEADPTPAAQYAAFHGDEPASWLAESWESLSASFAELRARLSYDWVHGLGWLGRRLATPGAGLAWPAAALALCVAGVLLARHLVRGLRGKWRRSPRRVDEASRGVQPELASLLARVDAGCAARGHPRPPHLAPMEHLEAVPGEALSSQARAASREVVVRYYEERFGGRRTDRDEVAQLGQALKAALASSGNPTR